MFSNVGKSVSSCGVYCVPCSLSHKLHGTQYTPQLETLFTNTAERIFTEYLHKFVTLARFGIDTLMMVQMDRNM